MPELVDLDPERQREIIELERAQEGLDHFALLGVGRTASADAMKQAFTDFSKRYHPERFADINLGSFRARIERIYRRVSEAYAVLSTPERREVYLKAHPHLRSATPVPGMPSVEPTPEPALPDEPLRSDEERRPERQARLARHPYLARTHRLSDLLVRGKAAITRGDFEEAYTDLNQVMNLDPKNREAATLLSEVRKKHDEQRGKLELQRGVELEKQQDLPKALEAYRKACTLDQQNADAAFRAARLARSLGMDWNEVRSHAQRAVDLAPSGVAQRILLAQVLLENKAGNLAKRHLQEALKLDPKNAEATALLRKSRWPF